MTTLSRTDAPPSVSLVDRYLRVRRFTERLCENLTPEDAQVQSMPDASPVKWHLAHTTWFFETFLLKRQADHRPLNEGFEHLFNSYYNSVGSPYPRPQRGLLTRPTWQEVGDYRAAVDDAMTSALSGSWDGDQEVAGIVRLGLNHEQQHQELILTDIKHALSHNPLDPVFMPAKQCDPPGEAAAAGGWADYAQGNYQIGHAGEGFHYDNEGPRHQVWLNAFRLARAPVTCGEYLQFMQDGGYQRPELWLSEGWNTVRQEGWTAPLYWRPEAEGGFTEFTLAGRRAVDAARPVTHLSYFEADAYARWAGGRLPTEAEWEVASAGQPIEGNFAEALLEEAAPLHPASQPRDAGPLQRLYGDSWEWTSSSYAPYPGYRAVGGALGEYNGKFMCNQYVLRGGSCASSRDHLRPTYRNFFPTAARWQFSGVRVAKDV